MTLNEITYRIASLLDGSDNPIFLEEIKFSVLYYRDLLLRRDDERSFRLPPDLLQTHTVTVRSDNGLFKGSLPTVCELKEGPAITSVTPSSSPESYGWCASKEELYYAASGKYTGAKGRFYKAGEFIWTNRSPAITVTGVFYDPREIMELQDVHDTDNQPFPITGAMVQRITAGMLSGELQLKPAETPQVTING